MLQILLHHISNFIERNTALPSDTEDERVLKFLVTTCLFGSFIFVLIYSVIFFMYNATGIAWLFRIWSIFLISSLILFVLKPAYFQSFIISQFIVFTLVTVIRMIILGGLINSGGQILFVVILPLSALVLFNVRSALYWFAFYIFLIFIDLILQIYNPISPLPKNIQIILVASSTIMSASLMCWILFYFVAQRDKAFHLLKQEQEKSEALLLNILPQKIAEKLKNDQSAIAEHFESASILFADVVSFTPLSAKLSPIELVNMLNTVFSYFDSLVEKYHVEKIKTIGDSYMVASGVPTARADHALVLTQLAVELRDYVNNNTFSGHKLTFRIGISSGPVVAGVIGQKKFTYDLWGDTVNTAARMEHQGMEGVIQTTQTTYELIKDDFNCEYQGMTHIKGKGEMAIWHILSAKNIVSPSQ